MIGTPSARPDLAAISLMISYSRELAGEEIAAVHSAEGVEILTGFLVDDVAPRVDAVQEGVLQGTPLGTTGLRAACPGLCCVVRLPFCSSAGLRMFFQFRASTGW